MLFLILPSLHDLLKPSLLTLINTSLPISLYHLSPLWLSRPYCMSDISYIYHSHYLHKSFVNAFYTTNSSLFSFYSNIQDFPDFRYFLVPVLYLMFAYFHLLQYLSKLLLVLACSDVTTLFSLL